MSSHDLRRKNLNDETIVKKITVLQTSNAVIIYQVV